MENTQNGIPNIEHIYDSCNKYFIVGRNILSNYNEKPITPRSQKKYKETNLTDENTTKY